MTCGTSARRRIPARGSAAGRVRWWRRSCSSRRSSVASRRSSVQGAADRVRKRLMPEDLGDLLEQPRVAVLATYRRNGSVLLSPVWHEWHDGGFNVVTGSSDIKTQHLRADPRASIVVYE